MSLKPIPDLQDDEQNAQVGRLTRLANAHKDAVHHLRDGYGKINSALSDAVIQQGIKECEEALARIKEVLRLSEQVSQRHG